MAEPDNIIRGGFDRDKYRLERSEREAAYEALSPFEKFWFYCARKEGKAKAKAKFDKITSLGGFDTMSLDRDSGKYEPLHLEATPEQLIVAAEAHRKHMEEEKREKSKILQPPQFLNQGRFEDYT